MPCNILYTLLGLRGTAPMWQMMCHSRLCAMADDVAEDTCMPRDKLHPNPVSFAEACNGYWHAPTIAVIQ